MKLKNRASEIEAMRHCSTSGSYSKPYRYKAANSMRFIAFACCKAEATKFQLETSSFGKWGGRFHYEELVEIAPFNRKDIRHHKLPFHITNMIGDSGHFIKLPIEKNHSLLGQFLFANYCIMDSISNINDRSLRCTSIKERNNRRWE